jgi:hypothetical protein
MKQSLEKYLKEKRFQLNVDQPDDDVVWGGIKAGMTNGSKTIPGWFWKVAAIFLFVVSTTYVVINETNRGRVVYITLADISPELGVQEARLQSIANQKWDEIKPFLTKGNSDFNYLFDELDEIESINEIYQKDLNEVGSNEFIIQALLDYHQKKIRILDRLLMEIKKQKNHEKNITL